MIIIRVANGLSLFKDTWLSMLNWEVPGKQGEVDQSNFYTNTNSYIYRKHKFKLTVFLN